MAYKTIFVKFLALFISFSFFSCEEAVQTTTSSNTSTQTLEHIVFVTSTSYPKTSFSSLGAADAICQTHASAAELKGKYKAILAGVDLVTARIKIAASVNNYDADKKRYLVTDDRNFLVEPSTHPLQNPIRYDENGDSVAGHVWTGIDYRANTNTFNCDDWQSLGHMHPVVVGHTLATDKSWVYNYGGYTCADSYHFYCISQQ